MATPMLQGMLLLCLAASTAGCAMDLPIERMSGEFDFPTLGKLNFERRFVVRDRAEWERQWQRITPVGFDARGRAVQRPAPAVNFTRGMILIAEMGLKGRHGFDVKIERVTDRGSALEAVVRQISPGPRCASAADNEAPTDIVRVPASPKPIRWRVIREVRDC